MMAAFQDPRLAPAMQEFTTDPQKALNKYKDNKEVMSFMQKFMGLMGGHFSDMAGKQQGRSSENKDSSNSGNSGDGSGNRVRKDESSAMGMGRGRGGGGDILTPAAASRQAAPLMTKRDPYHGNSGEYVDFNGKQVDKMTLQKWMSDPQIVSILNHPRTSMMLSEIGKDRTKFAKYARTPTILTLVRAGILDVPPEYAGMVNY